MIDIVCGNFHNHKKLQQPQNFFCTTTGLLMNPENNNRKIFCGNHELQLVF